MQTWVSLVSVWIFSLVLSGASWGSEKIRNVSAMAHGAPEGRTLEEIAAEARESAAPSGPTFIADELDKLDRLRQRGVLTQSEFDAQKAKLLAR